MKRGAWHQCGHNSHKLVLEQIEAGAGVGVILSPRDLAQDNAVEYTQKYNDLGASILCDQQFYVPEFLNAPLESYKINQHRGRVSQLVQLDNDFLKEFALDLKSVSEDLQVDAIVAPAVLYEAGRSDIIQLNDRFLQVAREVGQSLGKPTYATVVLGRSVTSSEKTLSPIMSHITGQQCDGWYFGFEFEPERVPSDRASIKRCCATGLSLACTSKPVLHAYAGLMAPLSLAFGATGAAIGHSQNLWKFTPDRWQTLPSQGGGGNAPPRFFSSTLWGTIISPDEVIRLSRDLQKKVLTLTPFSQELASIPPRPWSRWESNKHLVNLLCSTVKTIGEEKDPRKCANEVKTLLSNAVDLHNEIRNTGLILGDSTNLYQANWLNALSDLLADQDGGDYEFLSLLN